MRSLYPHPTTLQLTAGTEHLHALSQALQVVKVNESAMLLPANSALSSNDAQLIGLLPAISESDLGDSSFCQEYGVRFAYYAGAMAQGIHSEEMVIALGQQDILGFFGSGGLGIAQIDRALGTIKQHLPNKPFGINLLHNPHNPQWEMACVQLCIKHQVTVIEASAYIQLSAALVYYRAQGLVQQPDGTIERRQRIIAKVSRREVAKHFLQPAPDNILKQLLNDGLITATQAELARLIPMADDITVEGDSGGHTDQGVLPTIFYSVVKLRDQIANSANYPFTIRIGAAGGLGTPWAILAAFALGAAYVVTGSINQACVEAGTSNKAKQLLAQAQINDVTMAPCADMFELGAKVKVLKQGSLYAMRAQKLYALYKQYPSLEALPNQEIELLEKQILGKTLATVWQETVAYFEHHHQLALIEQAQQQPKKKMALIFRWYLGQSSLWAIDGDDTRHTDFQIWCSSAMGANNEWLQGTPLEDVAQRKVAQLACLLMKGAAYLMRINQLELLHIAIPTQFKHYLPDAATLSAALNATPRAQQTRSGWYNNSHPSMAICTNTGCNSRIWDLAGNEYLDLSCQSGALLFGHNNTHYNQQLIKYISQITSVKNNPLTMEVCEIMAHYIPSAEAVQFYAHDSEAMQHSLHLARQFTGKNQIIYFNGHCNRFNNIMPSAQDYSLLPWNDIELLSTLLARSHAQIAALLMEPICLSSGGIFPQAGYLEKVKILCEKYNIVLIFDETITGIRIGLGGAQQLLGVTPHLSILGNTLSGGTIPISALAGRRDILELSSAQQKADADIANNYLLACAAIKTTFSMIERDPHCYQQMANVSQQLANLFVNAAKAADIPLVIQGMPTALVFHAQQTPIKCITQYDDKVKFCNTLIANIAQQHGIYFSPLAHIYTNLLISQDDVHFFEQRIFDTMTNVRKILTCSPP